MGEVFAGEAFEVLSFLVFSRGRKDRPGSEELLGLESGVALTLISDGS